MLLSTYSVLNTSHDFIMKVISRRDDLQAFRIDNKYIPGK